MNKSLASLLLAVATVSLAQATEKSEVRPKKDDLGTRLLTPWREVLIVTGEAEGVKVATKKTRKKTEAKPKI